MNPRIKKQLTPEQSRILKDKGTELSGSGKWLHNKDTGLYTCAGRGTVLFDSTTKFDSGIGWPSFTDATNVELKQDMSHGMIRNEVVCKNYGGHLGHVFQDGHGSSGKRFCINSCALEFEKK